MKTQRGMTATNLLWQVPIAAVVIIIGVMVYQGMSEKRAATARRVAEQQDDAQRIAEEKRVREEAAAEAQRIAAEAQRRKEMQEKRRKEIELNQKVQEKKIADEKRLAADMNKRHEQMKEIKRQKFSREIYKDPLSVAELYMEHYGVEEGRYYSHKFKFFVTLEGHSFKDNWQKHVKLYAERPRGSSGFPCAKLYAEFSIICSIKGKKTRGNITLLLREMPLKWDRVDDRPEWYVSIDYDEYPKWPPYLDDLTPNKRLTEMEAMRQSTNIR